jgi:hypothetical protein
MCKSPDTSRKKKTCSRLKKTTDHDRYVHVCACICICVHVCAGIYSYVPEYAVYACIVFMHCMFVQVCHYVLVLCVCVGIVGMCRHVTMCRYCMYVCRHCRYEQVFHSVQVLHVCVGIAGMCRYVTMRRYCMHV